MVRIRHFAWLALTAAFLTGCDAWHRAHTRADDALKYSGIDRQDPSLERPDELKGFFSGTNSGGWSSQARDIEKSLGAY
jgi:hypothetical protein